MEEINTTKPEAEIAACSAEACEDIAEKTADPIPDSDGEAESGEEKRVDWQGEYEKSEARLKHSLAFASLFAPYAKEGEDIASSAVYTRFLELVEKGLSTEEAFAAACRRATGGDASASKAHLRSGVPQTRVTPLRLSGEEMAIARELLGETHSDRELERLFRRVKNN